MFNSFKVYSISIDKYFYILLIIFGLAINRKRIKDSLKAKPIKYLSFFTAWALLINSIRAYQYGNKELLLNAGIVASIYLFCLLCYILLTSVRRSEFISLFVFSSFAGLVITYISSFFGFPHGFFNNMNQLGRFALIFTCCSVIIHKNEKINISYILLALSAGVGMALTFANVRRAAMIGFVILLVLLLAKEARLLLCTLLFFILSLGSLYLFSNKSLEKNINHIEHRFSEKGKEDTFMGRGFSRILDYPKLIILGAGEGYFERFNDIKGVYYEFHATYGNLLFSYGILGITFFLAFQLALIDGNYHLLYWVLPIIFYTLFGNTLRSVYFLLIPFLMMRFSYSTQINSDFKHKFVK